MSQNKFIPEGIRVILGELVTPFYDFLPNPAWDGHIKVNEELKKQMEKEHNVEFSNRIVPSIGSGFDSFWAATAILPDGRRVTVGEGNKVPKHWEGLRRSPEGSNHNPGRRK